MREERGSRSGSAESDEHLVLVLRFSAVSRFSSSPSPPLPLLRETFCDWLLVKLRSFLLHASSSSHQAPE